MRTLDRRDDITNGVQGRSQFLLNSCGVAVLATATTLGFAMPDFAAAQITKEPDIFNSTGDNYREQKGDLPDGTEYLIRVPNEWNGKLIRDLDYAARVDSPGWSDRYNALFDRGYALAGTARHPLREWQYDPAREVENLDLVLDHFDETFGEPEYVIQYGCSGGGHTALAIAEDFSDRVDGAVVLSAHTPVWLMNTFLDGWFVLQTLIGEYYVEAGFGPASNLAITELPNDGSSNTDTNEIGGALPKEWQKAFEAAEQSPAGRARMALAFELGQWPVWTTGGGDQHPDLADAGAMQEAMYHTLMLISKSPGGAARTMFENSAQGQQLSWTDNVDYAKYFENGNPAVRNTVEKLYEEAGLDLQKDIHRINDAAGVLASAHALEYWGAAGRNVVGDPEVPVFRLHGLGDHQIPYTLMLGYRELVADNGKEGMFRAALIDSTEHCTGFAINAVESTTAVEVISKRLETGEWPSTEPQDLNELAASLGLQGAARFIPVGDYDIPKFNRGWVPGVEE